MENLKHNWNKASELFGHWIHKHLITEMRCSLLQQQERYWQYLRLQILQMTSVRIAWLSCAQKFVILHLEMNTDKLDDDFPNDIRFWANSTHERIALMVRCEERWMRWKHEIWRRKKKGWDRQRVRPNPSCTRRSSCTEQVVPHCSNHTLHMTTQHAPQHPRSTTSVAFPERARQHERELQRCWEPIARAT